MLKLSDRSKCLKQSGIRSASVRCAAIDGINLGQGVCDIPIVDPIKEGAYSAIREDKSLYSPYNGIESLRNALSKKIKSFNGISVNPETEIMVTHGATGGFVTAILALLNPGDEVILFEPFYGYHQHLLQLYGMSIKTVPIDLKTFDVNIDAVRKVITKKTRCMVICTPNNPTGKVFTKEELSTLGDLARENNLAIITDEIYEYITYPGHHHVSIASLEDHFERTITLSGFSKTYNMTGWRLGYAHGPASVIEKMSLLQDLIYVCPPTPLQHAGLSALALDDSYYKNLAHQYLVKRDEVVEALRALGFELTSPQGAYYLMADIQKLGLKNDVYAAEFLLNHAKVATVPGHSFYEKKDAGQNILRICYALEESKVKKALHQMKEALSQAYSCN